MLPSLKTPVILHRKPLNLNYGREIVEFDEKRIFENQFFSPEIKSLLCESSQFVQNA